jgi:hypothetical protein
MGRKAIMTPYPDLKRVANKAAQPRNTSAAPKFSDSSHKLNCRKGDQEAIPSLKFGIYSV